MPHPRHRPFPSNPHIHLFEVPVLTEVLCSRSATVTNASDQTARSHSPPNNLHCAVPEQSLQGWVRTVVSFLMSPFALGETREVLPSIATGEVILDIVPQTYHKQRNLTLSLELKHQCRWLVPLLFFKRIHNLSAVDSS